MNEHVVAGGRRPAEVFEILFECADTGCMEHVRVTTASYERARGQPTDFVLKPGHVKPEFETVIESHEDFVLVRKTGEAAASRRNWTLVRRSVARRGASGERVWQRGGRSDEAATPYVWHLLNHGITHASLQTFDEPGLSMVEGFVLTVRREEGWANTIEGQDGALPGTFETKEAALAAGRDEAIGRKTEHVIHDEDCTIAERNSYGGDPSDRAG